MLNSALEKFPWVDAEDGVHLQSGAVKTPCLPTFIHIRCLCFSLPAPQLGLAQSTAGLREGDGLIEWQPARADSPPEALLPGPFLYLRASGGQESPARRPSGQIL